MSWIAHYRQQAELARWLADQKTKIGRHEEAEQYRLTAETYERLADESSIALGDQDSLSDQGLRRSDEGDPQAEH